MKIYRFWAEVTIEGDAGAKCFGASNVSVEDARRQAHERARRLDERLRAGDFPDPYPYPDRPVREEIVQTLSGDEHDPGRATAVLTRNAYGALILNSEHVLFADIDGKPAGGGGLLKRLFGGGSHASPVDRIRAAVEAMGGIRFRLYETCAGHRGVVMNRTFDPASDETKRLLEAVNSDPTYVRLCRGQESFRARLTPKPWRCGATMPPVRFPFANAEAESSYRQWESAYDDRASSFATCRVVDEFGDTSAAVVPEVALVLDVHDRYACAEGLSLA